MQPAKPNRRRRGGAPLGLGPIADLESHLPEDWWSKIFDKLYLMTDGDVVEDDRNTRAEIDMIVEAAGLVPDDRILDLCCGQGRHVLELARRGYTNVTGIDRSRYLIRLARKRARQADLAVTLREGDARTFRMPEMSLDAVLILGNAFGYFAAEADDRRVLDAATRVLRSGGTLVLDITDGAWTREHFDARSWEWIDQHHFVCRERALSADGDRLISREVIVNDERGVIADQFYAERLYDYERLVKVLEEAGYRAIRRHADIETRSERGQDLGMMAHRVLVTATAPRHVAAGPKRGKAIDVAVLLGDPRLPDEVKLGGQFNPEDMATVIRLKDALSELGHFRFRYLDNHHTLVRDLLTQNTDIVFNLLDEGFNNDPFKELHVPALLEVHDMPYTGAGPACLAMCYDKALVRSVAQSLDVPVPLETFVRAGDQSATLPSAFPAILKPNFGDSSVGITKNAVVGDQRELIDYLESLRGTFPNRPILVQEFLGGAEYSVTLIGNPTHGLKALPVLEVDFSGLDPSLPRILGYESKWDPQSAYWNQIHYRPAELPDDVRAELVEYSSRLFERLACRDYARFDFRANARGQVKLLEVNPNPGWCWDGKVNLMAGFAGMRYAELLDQMLGVACERTGARAKGVAAVDSATVAAEVESEAARRRC